MSVEMFLHCVISPWAERGGFDLVPLLQEWVDEIKANSVQADNIIKCRKCDNTFKMPKGFNNPIICEDCDPAMNAAAREATKGGDVSEEGSTEMVQRQCFT